MLFSINIDRLSLDRKNAVMFCRTSAVEYPSGDTSIGDRVTVSERLTQSIRALLGSSLSQLFWYGLLACGVWLFFDIAFRAKFRHRRISRHEPTPRQVAREIVCSFRSIAIFGLVTGAVVYGVCCGWTLVY